MTPPPTRAESLAVLAAVAACPDRGPVLPLAEQPYVTRGCHCGELSRCDRGKGEQPEGVSLEECVRCRWAAAHPDPAC